MLPEAYIFDLDGTLVDSLDDIADALNRALAENGLPTAPSDEVRGWVGDGLRTLCARAAPGLDPGQLERLVRSAESHYKRAVVVKTRPYPNILKMLDLLQSRSAKMAVLSNKPDALTREVVRQLNLDHFFSVVQGATTDESRKPSPDAALSIARGWGCAPGDIFFVGDSLIDIATAVNSGMVSVAVSWGFVPREKILSARPNFVVDDPLQIPNLVEK